MQALLAIVGFVLFLGLVELAVYAYYYVPAKLSGRRVPSAEERVDGTSVLVFAFMGLGILILIGELYKRLGG